MLLCYFTSNSLYVINLGSPPFTGSDPLKTYNIILKGIDAVSFPANLFPSGKGARDLIKRLCKDNPAERIGIQKGRTADIQKHKYNLCCIILLIQFLYSAPHSIHN